MGNNIRTRCLRDKLAFLLLFLPIVFGACGTPEYHRVRTGMTKDEVRDLIGNPDLERRGITFLDSSRIAMIMRKSNIPVVNSPPSDDRLLWMYEHVRRDTGAITRKGGRGQPAGKTRYVCESWFGVLFDESGSRVQLTGYYPVSIHR